MYNTDLPRRADLPTSAELVRSTVFAAIAAGALLVAVVLPSEFAIDPTGVGRLLGLTQMGEIKTRIAAEAAADAAATATAQPVQATPSVDAIVARLDRIEAAVLAQPRAAPPATPPVATTARAEPAPAATASLPPDPLPPAGRSDEVSIVLTPGQGAEIKLVMRQGARANFEWRAAGGPVNFDTHGDAPGKSTSYEKGRSVESDDGVLEAVFDGNHGWFWRNRGTGRVTITLRTSGDYAELKRVL